MGLDRRKLEGTRVHRMAVPGLEIREITKCYSAAIDGRVTSKQASLMPEAAVQKQRSKVLGPVNVLGKLTDAGMDHACSAWLVIYRW